MDRSELDRRHFAKWTVAAFGGMVAGSIGGCGSSDSDAPVTPQTDAPPEPAADTNPPPVDAADKSKEVAKADVHVCRGLNACEGKGALGKNSCAGQGACATAAPHSCHGQNECKGQGGCGEKPGQNDCKGQGECSVPLMDAAWEKARAAFEAKMKKDGKEIGTAPAKKAS